MKTFLIEMVGIGDVAPVYLCDNHHLARSTDPTAALRFAVRDEACRFASRCDVRDQPLRVVEAETAP